MIKMTFKIISNPPFHLGKHVIHVNTKFKGVWLVPLSCFKYFQNFKFIESIEKANGMFDADISSDLMIIESNHFFKETNDYNKFQIEYLFDSGYKFIYTHNLKYKNRFIEPIDTHIGLSEKDIYNFIPDDQSKLFVFPRRQITSKRSNNHSIYKFNHNIADKYCLSVYYLPNENIYRLNDLIYSINDGKDNLIKFMEIENGLFDKLLKGLNSSGLMPHLCFPQIDWQKIENNELWKKGDYDGAVLEEIKNLC